MFHRGGYGRADTGASDTALALDREQRAIFADWNTRYQPAGPDYIVRWRPAR